MVFCRTRSTGYRGKVMEITVRIPDELAERLGPDVERRLIETLWVEEFRAARITEPELRRLLGGPSLYELDGILKAHGVYYEYTLEEIEQQVGALKQLGF
jgi:hypothetical protein